MINCKLDLNAILTDNSAGGSPALLFVDLFNHQLFVTGVTKTSKTGLPLFLSAKGYLGISKSETDPIFSSLMLRSGYNSDKWRFNAWLVGFIPLKRQESSLQASPLFLFLRA